MCRDLSCLWLVVINMAGSRNIKHMHSKESTGGMHACDMLKLSQYGGYERSTIYRVKPKFLVNKR